MVTTPGGKPSPGTRTGMEFSPSIESTIHDPGLNTLTKLTTRRGILPLKVTALAPRSSHKIGWARIVARGLAAGNRRGLASIPMVQQWYAGSLCEACHRFQGALRGPGRSALSVKLRLPESESATQAVASTVSITSQQPIRSNVHNPSPPGAAQARARMARMSWAPRLGQADVPPAGKVGNASPFRVGWRCLEGFWTGCGPC